MTLTARLANYVCDMRLEDFDPGVVGRTKNLLLSSFGSTLLGSTMDISRTMADYARALGGNPDATVAGTGLRTTIEMAAALNCIFSHCTEYEDVAWPEAQYTCFLLPAMLTLGEAIQASGRAVLESVILGFEVAARPGMTCSDHGAAARGFLSCANVGTIGVAAGAARLMGLARDQIRDAIALSASLGGGLVRQTGSAAHVVEAGFAARDGIMAAQLAKRGIGGNPTILDGKAGYFDALAGQPAIQFELGTGKDLRVMQVGQKKYPCCYLLQRIIDAMKAVVAEHGLAPNRVAGVVVAVNEAFSNIVKYDDPEDAEQARFSLPFAVAAVLCGEAMDWRTFSADGIANARIRDAMGKVSAMVVPGSGFAQLSTENHIIISTADGRVIETICRIAHGDACSPLSVEEVIGGFREKTDGLISGASAQQAIDLTLTLENLDDVGPLARIGARLLH